MGLSIDHHIYFHLPPLGEDPSQIMHALGVLQEGVTRLSAEFEAIKAAVEENNTVDQSVITLVNQLVAKIDAIVARATELDQLKADLTGLTSELSASNQQVADVVTANTPAVPDEPPAPGPEGMRRR